MGVEQPLGEGVGMEEVGKLYGHLPHMDVLEEDKLEWTKSLPKRDPQQKSKENRFSFDGLVLPHTIDVPTHLGLHHHGDNPEVISLNVSNFPYSTDSSHPTHRNLATQYMNCCI
jgi:hypothetical protein